MGQFDRVIAKLERLKTALGNVRPFYITHLPRWRERAKRITVAVLMNMRPPTSDAEAWRRRVATESERVSGLLSFSEEEAGAIISLGIKPAGVPENDPRHFSIGGMSVDDVVRWVEAGREKVDPEEPGKNLDERDANKSDLQIAWPNHIGTACSRHQIQVLGKMLWSQTTLCQQFCFAATRRPSGLSHFQPVHRARDGNFSCVVTRLLGGDIFRDELAT